jgi:hypothetical protein
LAGVAGRLAVAMRGAVRLQASVIVLTCWVSLRLAGDHSRHRSQRRAGTVDAAR